MKVVRSIRSDSIKLAHKLLICGGYKSGIFRRSAFQPSVVKIWAYHLMFDEENVKWSKALRKGMGSIDNVWVWKFRPGKL